MQCSALKAKLAKYRAQLLEPDKKSAKGEGFDVLKSGGKSFHTFRHPVGRGISPSSDRCACRIDRFPFRRKVDTAVKSHQDGEYNRCIRVHDTYSESPYAPKQRVNSDRP